MRALTWNVALTALPTATVPSWSGLLLDRKRTTIDPERVRSDLDNLSRMLVADARDRE